MRLKAMVLALVLGSGPLSAKEPSDAFVASNVVSILYHEIGHAVIDLMRLPIFGQEEDAADVLSALLIDEIYEEQTAQNTVRDAAFGFYAEAQNVDEPAYWDVHGPDEQRYYNLVCLFYGGNPAQRAGLAAQLGLPEDRAETCQEEYELAYDSWGPVLDDLAGLSHEIELTNFADGLMADVLIDEIIYFNTLFRFPAPVSVELISCGEANAFYDPETVLITICSEFDAYLRRQYDNL